MLVFLNSELYRYLYRRLFGEIKILPGNLKKLPLPLLNRQENETAEGICRGICRGGPRAEELIEEADRFVYACMGVREEDRSYIHQCLSLEKG